MFPIVSGDHLGMTPGASGAMGATGPPNALHPSSLTQGQGQGQINLLRDLETLLGKENPPMKDLVILGIKVNMDK